MYYNEEILLRNQFTCLNNGVQLCDLYEQLVSRQEISSNKALMEVATKLYFDENSNSLKKGAGSRNKNGTPDRLTKIVNQLSRTWDLYGMKSSQILDLLPKEFDRFRV